MGKKSGAAGQRTKKKHAKEQKRKVAVAKKRVASAAYAGAAKARAPAITWSPDAGSVKSLAAEMRVPFYEAAHAADYMGETPEERDLLSPLWTPSKMASRSTQEILEDLERLGAPTKQDAFVAETPRFGSAVEYALATWLPLVPAVTGDDVYDFVCLAACELWKRWRPDPPSQEMLLDHLLRGRVYEHDNDVPAAVESWLRFWALLRPLLTVEMRATAAVDALLGGAGGPVFNWAGDFAMTATFAARSEPDLGRRAAQALREILEQFTEESDGWRLPVAQDRAEVLYLAGEREEGERILREQIAAHPKMTGGYATLAELWAPHDCTDREQVALALALLEQAAAVPVEDGDDWDLDDRIEELRGRR